MKRFITLLSITTLLSLNFVFAHSDFEGSVPKDGALLEQAPTEIVLNFKEDIQPSFSIFKVYALPADMLTESTSESSDQEHNDSHSDEGSSSEEHIESSDHGAMDAAAKLFIPTVIELQDDEDTRADNGLALTEKLAKSVTITLKENLAPGAYVVMFRALSADTHTVEGFITFEISE
jgi:methionine-rich copper-binding protein CopC